MIRLGYGRILRGAPDPSKTEPLRSIGVDEGSVHSHAETTISEPKFQITVTETGPDKVEGPVPVVDHEGNGVETREGKPFFLCRCGLSANKPFCDGAHNRTEWDHKLADR